MKLGTDIDNRRRRGAGGAARAANGNARRSREREHREIRTDVGKTRRGETRPRTGVRTADGAAEYGNHCYIVQDCETYSTPTFVRSLIRSKITFSIYLLTMKRPITLPN